MNVFECGANCIGLGSTSNIKKIFNYDTSQTTLIIALDNDNAGLKATTELEKLCKQYKTAYINAPTTIWNGYKDANELLITNKGTLIENLNEQISKALSFNRENWTDIQESHLKLYLEQSYDLLVSVENISHIRVTL